MSVCTVLPSVIIPFKCVWVHTHQANSGWAQFAKPTEFHLHITQAPIRWCVKRSDPKSLLHFQEPPLEWQRERVRRKKNRKTMAEHHVLPSWVMARTPSVAVSQCIDIYIVFPLGCRQGAKGGWSPAAVASGGINVDCWSLYVRSRASWALVNRSNDRSHTTLRFN